MDKNGAIGAKNVVERRRKRQKKSGKSLWIFLLLDRQAWSKQHHSAMTTFPALSSPASLLTYKSRQSFIKIISIDNTQHTRCLKNVARFTVQPLTLQNWQYLNITLKWSNFIHEKDSVLPGSKAPKLQGSQDHRITGSQAPRLSGS